MPHSACCRKKKKISTMRLRKQIRHHSLILLYMLSWVAAENDGGGHHNRGYNFGSNEEKLTYADTIQSKKVDSGSSPNANFPKFLDLRSLQNMPLVIIRPKIPVKLHLLPANNFGNHRPPFNSERNPKSLDQGTSYTETNVRIQEKPQTHQQFGALNRPAHVDHGPRDIRPDNTQQKTAKYGVVGPRQIQQPNNQNGGWMNRIRGSISNFLPRMNAFHRPPMLFAAPTMARPIFPPHFGNIHPFAAAVNRPVFMHPFHPPIIRQPLYHPFVQPNSATYGMDELSAFASNRLPIGAMHPSLVGHHPLRPHPLMNFYEGGDLYASASGPVPMRVPPPDGRQPVASASSMYSHKTVPSLKNHLFANYAAKFPRHRPLFKNVDGIGATSMEITNAFADFADSPEHGHDVNQRFGAVGDSINKFLQMMGLGVAGFTNSEIGAFGGAGDMASYESSPIARSFDYFPGYGNQAHLDHMEDEEIFEEDITDIFNKKFTKPPTMTEAPPHSEMKITASKMEGKKTTMAMKPTTQPVIMSTLPQKMTSKSMYMPTVNSDTSEEIKDDYMGTKSEKFSKAAPTYPFTESNSTSNIKSTFPQQRLKTQVTQGDSQMDMKTNHLKLKDKQIPPLGDPKFYFSDYIKNPHNEKVENDKQSINNRPHIQIQNGLYAQAHTISDGHQFHSMPGEHQAPKMQYYAAPLHQNKDELQESNKNLYPSVNYNVPPTHHTVSPEDIKPPILIYQNLPPTQLHLNNQHAVITIETESKPLEQNQSIKYASAHALSVVNQNYASAESSKAAQSQDQSQWTHVNVKR